MVSLEDNNMTSKVCIIHTREAAKKDEIKNVRVVLEGISNQNLLNKKFTLFT